MAGLLQFSLRMPPIETISSNAPSRRTLSQSALSQCTRSWLSPISCPVRRCSRTTSPKMNGYRFSSPCPLVTAKPHYLRTIRHKYFKPDNQKQNHYAQCYFHFFTFPQLWHLSTYSALIAPQNLQCHIFTRHLLVKRKNSQSNNYQYDKNCCNSTGCPLIRIQCK